jgi:ribosomal protein S18 acetylase RimI-like enzyme
MNDNSANIELKLVGRLRWLIFKKSFKKSFREDPELRNATRVERFFLFRMIRKNAENYLCYFNGKRAGVLSIRTNRGAEVFVYAVAVESKFRKKGLGNFMMNYSEQRAKKLKKKFMALAVLWNNLPALELYKKLNYKTLGEGHTYLELRIEKIQQKRIYDLKFERITVYNKSVRKSFENILLQGIRDVSGNLGVEYMKRNRITGYHPQIKKNIEEGRGRLFKIVQNQTVLGYLFERYMDNTSKVTVFSKNETWNLDFFEDLSSAIKKYLIKSSNISHINMRLPINVVNSIEGLEKSKFERDRSTDKLILFKEV